MTERERGREEGGREGEREGGRERGRERETGYGWAETAVYPNCSVIIVSSGLGSAYQSSCRVSTTFRLHMHHDIPGIMHLVSEETLIASSLLTASECDLLHNWCIVTF